MDIKKIAVIILTAVLVLLGVRFIFGGSKDTWVCKDSQWIKQGNPTKPMPTSNCGDQNKSKISVTPGNQKTAVYKASDFEITYPVWSNISKENLIDPTATRIAVANAGCNFLVTARSIPKDQIFKTYAGKMIDDEIQSNNVKVVKKEVKNDSSFVESSFSIEKAPMYSTSNGYFTSSRQFYNVIFVSSKELFEKSCRPLIKSTIDSVKVK